MTKKIKDDSHINDGIEHQSVVPVNDRIEEQKKEFRKKRAELMKSMTTHEAIIHTLDGQTKKVSELNLEEQEVEILRCAKDPIYFIETYFTIFHQTQGDAGKIVPFKLFPFQKKVIHAYKNNQLNVANKYRQAGISTTTSAFIAWYVSFNEHRNVAIVADKLETARDEMMRDVVDFMDMCPKWLVPQPTKRDNQKHKHYSNDCQLRAFASSSLRGYTPTLLFWDETAWAEKNDKFWTAARPAVMNTGGKAIFVSTPNGLDPVFYKTFQGARMKENNFNAIELWWYNDPRYNTNKEGKLDLEWVKNKGKEKEIRMKDEGWSEEHRAKLVEDGWEATSSWFEDQIKDYNGDMKKLAQELLCSFLGSGDNFIAEEYLKRIEEEEIMTPLRQEYEDLEMWIYEDPKPEEEYVMALDASAGHGDDYSTINIFKIHEITEDRVININGKLKKKKFRTHKLVHVAEYYNKIRPQNLAEIAYIYGEKYNYAYCIVDVTGGYGGQTIEKLLERGYPNIHYSEITHKPTRDKLSGYIKVGQKVLPDGKMVTVDLVPGFLIAQNRGSILTEMQRAINLQDITIRSIRLLNELKTFVTVPGTRVADHKRSFHDDSIMGMACAIYVVNYQMTNFKKSQSKTKKMLDAYMKLEGDEVVEKVNKRDNPNSNTRTPDYRITKRNPYGSNAWLFAGLKK
jgi:hypothetical protein